MHWWAIGVFVYVLIGILIGRKIGKPSTIFDAILVGLIWALFWPFMLLLVEFLRRLLREEGPRNGGWRRLPPRGAPKLVHKADAVIDRADRNNDEHG